MALAACPYQAAAFPCRQGKQDLAFSPTAPGQNAICFTKVGQKGAGQAMKSSFSGRQVAVPSSVACTPRWTAATDFRQNSSQRDLPDSNEEFLAGPSNDASGTQAPALKEEPISRIERLEHQAKISIAKLKHILYRLKTRPLANMIEKTVTKDIIRESQEMFVSQRIEGGADGFSMQQKPSTRPLPDQDRRASSSSASSSLKDSSSSNSNSPEEQVETVRTNLDSVTCTKTTVNFEEKSQTAVVTVSATVRAAEMVEEEGGVEQTVAIAARALARTCLALDEKAQIDASRAGRGENPMKSASKGSDWPVVRTLERGRVVRWRVAGPEFGGSPFRKVFEVVVKGEDGQQVEALFKQVVPGDAHSRWQRAPADWVAYQTSSLLGLDAVPTAVVRNGLRIGKRKFAAGVLVAKPEKLQSVQESSHFENPEAMLSSATNVHVLDALLGNAARHPEHFLSCQGLSASSNNVSSLATSAAEAGGLQAISLTHPAGPFGGSVLNMMWSNPHAEGGLKKISPVVLARLKSMNKALLLECFNGALTSDEMDAILENRDQVVFYFERIARRRGRNLVFA